MKYTLSTQAEYTKIKHVQHMKNLVDDILTPNKQWSVGDLKK